MGFWTKTWREFHYLALCLVSIIAKLMFADLYHSFNKTCPGFWNVDCHQGFLYRSHCTKLRKKYSIWRENEILKSTNCNSCKEKFFFSDALNHLIMDFFCVVVIVVIYHLYVEIFRTHSNAYIYFYIACKGSTSLLCII